MCLYTKYIKNPKYLPNKKNGYNPPKCEDKRLLYVPVSCGICIECRKRKKREWMIRLNEELQKNKNAIFVTLTFNEESLKELEEKLSCKKPNYTELNNVCYYALRHFMELIRKNNNGKYPKYWCITELGEDFERIHMHGIIWCERRLIEKWKYGYYYIGDYVNEKTINYITKYMLKIPEKNRLFVGKVMCSKGLGAGYWKSYNAKRNVYQDNNTNEMYKLRNGTEIPLPQYYRNYIYNEEQKEKLWLEKQERGYRYIGGEKVDMNNDEEWNNLTQYYQQQSEGVWKIDPIEWDREKQRKRLTKMKIYRQRMLKKLSTAKKVINKLSTGY